MLVRVGHDFACIGLEDATLIAKACFTTDIILLVSAIDSLVKVFSHFNALTAAIVLFLSDAILSRD